MFGRRLEDRIAQLTRQLIDCDQEGEEFKLIAIELQASLAKHSERVLKALSVRFHAERRKTE